MELPFLQDLENGNYNDEKPLTEKEIKKQQKENLAESKRISTERERDHRNMEKATQRQAKLDAKEDEDKPMGADKIKLLIRINKYKELFPDELKNFKMKKNPNVEQLEEYIKELEILVESGGIDAFFNDMMLECIKGCESLSSNTTNYNLSGLSVLLKSNKKFNTLCKQLQLKYNLFVNVPPEIQLILIISTTSVLCMNKNKHKAELNSYLDQPIETEIIV